MTEGKGHEEKRRRTMTEKYQTQMDRQLQQIKEEDGGVKKE